MAVINVGPMQVSVRKPLVFGNILTITVTPSAVAVHALFGAISFLRLGEMSVLKFLGVRLYKRCGQVFSVLGVVTVASQWVHGDGGWRHRPVWKVACNTLLRAVQFWRAMPLLVVTDAEWVEGREPKVIGYRMMRVPMSARGEVEDNAT